MSGSPRYCCSPPSPLRFTNCLVVTEDYEDDDAAVALTWETRGPEAAIRAAAEAVGALPDGFGTDPDSVVLNSICGGYTGVAFIVDEISELYQVGAKKPDDMVRIQSNVLRAGRNTNCFVLASGSSNDLPDMAFCRAGWARTAYCNLNHTVFKLHTLSPLCSVETVDKYCTARYGALPDGVTAEALFRVTGGVGRDIHDIVRQLRPADALADAKRTACSEFRSMAANPDWVRLFALLRTKSQTLRTLSKQDALRACSQIELSRMVNESLLLYTHGRPEAPYSLLKPELSTCADEAYVTDSDRASMEALTQTLLTGGAGVVGVAAEPTVVCRHFKAVGLETKPSGATVITVEHGVPHTDVTGGHLGLAEVPLDALTSKYLKLASENGLDFFTVTKADDTEYEVTGGQVKLGKFHKPGKTGRVELPAGKLERQREVVAYNEEKKDAGKSQRKNFDVSAAAAVVKGERGSAAVLDILCDAFPGVQFNLQEFVLLTSEVVSDSMFDKIGEFALSMSGEELPVTVVANDFFWDAFEDGEVQQVQPPADAGAGAGAGGGRVV